LRELSSKTVVDNVAEAIHPPVRSGGCGCASDPDDRENHAAAPSSAAALIQAHRADVAAVTPMLDVSADLKLPIDAVTETFLIFGRKGSGKTATAGVFAEELIGAGLPVAVLDPMGAWWGLRSSADGRKPGLPVLIAGGEHGDIPLQHSAGALMADLIVEEHLPMVLDMFEMSKTQQRQFVTEYMERLFHRNREPMHLIIDEADRWAPQRGTHDGARLLGAYEDIVLRGRRLGLGSTSITLRIAQLHASIRSQVAVLVAMQMLGKLDIDAMDEWIRVHAREEDARELKASLPKLPVGTAWVWSPGWLDLLQKVQIRPRWTFDSSATPKVGEKRIVPRSLAEIDLTAIEARMAAVIDKTAQDDPKALKRQIAELQRQIAELQRQPAATPSHAAIETAVRAYRADNEQLRARNAELENRPPERVEVPAFQASELAGLRELAMSLSRSLNTVTTAIDVVLAAQAEASPPAVPPRPAPAVHLGPSRRQRPASSPPVQTPALKPADSTSKPLTKAERTLLTVLAQFPAGRTRIQLGLLAHYSSKTGHFSNTLGALRTAGLVERGEPLRATPMGIAAVADSYEPLPTGQALVDHWMHELSKAERTILLCLLDVYPGSMTRDELAEASGYSAKTGHFSNSLGRLRSLELVNRDADIRADDNFAREVGR
jgi:uncharacterized protein